MSQNLSEALLRIPLFKNLTPTEIKPLLSLCKPASYDPGTKIYEAGSSGTEMLILLKGTVRVLLSDGTEVATDTVGEMEIVGALQRTADIVAADEVSGLTISKGVLEGLFQNAPNMGIGLLRNIVENIAHKLSDTNKELAARISHEGGSQSKEKYAGRRTFSDHGRARMYRFVGGSESLT